MRPIYLKMKAFGAYSGCVEIDLDTLGENGLYLITGDTGAGKTTIFDAITYALYGKTSGENRSGEMMRSKYASPETPTVVELEFEYSGKVYKVRRNPSYERPVLRGSGTTTQKQDASLTFPDGRVVHSYNDVTVEIQKLLGISKSEFTQIAMIAQGDFMRLLMAEAKERMRIFNRLFRTQYFHDLQDYINSEALAAERSREAANTDILRYLGGIRCREDDTRALLAKSGKLHVSEAAKAVDSLIKRDSEELKDVKKLIKKLDAEIGSASERVGKGEEHMRLIDELTASKATFAANEKLLGELKNALEKCRSELPRVEEIDREIALIEAKYADFEVLKKRTDELDSLGTALSELDAQIKSAEKSRSDAERSASDAESELQSLGDSGARLTELNAEKKQVTERVQALTALEVEYKEYRDISADIADRNSQLERLESEKKALTERSDKLAKSIAELDKIRTKTESAAADRERTEHEIQTVSGDILALDDIEKRLAEHDRLSKKLDKAKAEYVRKAELADEASEAYSRNYRAFLDEQAGILAESLEDGHPCPVCGSESHPQPARRSENAPSEDDLKRLKAQCDESMQSAAEASRIAGELGGQVETSKKHLLADARKQFKVSRFADIPKKTADKRVQCTKILDDLTANLSDIEKRLEERRNADIQLKKLTAELDSANSDAKKLDEQIRSEERDIQLISGRLQQLLGDILAKTKSPDADGAGAWITAQLADSEKVSRELDALIEAENKRIDRRNKLTDELPKLREIMADTAKKLAELSERSAAEKSRYTELSKQIGEIRAGLGFDDLESAKSKANALTIEKTKLRTNLESAEKGYNSKLSEQNTLKGRLANLREQIPENAKELLDEAVELKKSLTTKRQHYINEQQELHSAISANKLTLANVTKSDDRSSELSKRCEMLGDLAKTATGNIAGKEKITLETYVQMSYFDRIIGRANNRLRVMTDGQYELVRRAVADDNRMKSGLELNVLDHFNGSERSVKTLSGGESFMASLALALGLSEEVQCSSGGIRLDAMFIDEGFGTLDEETLDQAMKAISDLAEGTRLVGIISHVAELKNRIDRQIVVTKTRDAGSRVEIIV